jgi:hypothetical protein
MTMMCFNIWSIDLSGNAVSYMWVDRCIYVGAQAKRRKVTRCQAMHYLSLRVLTPACKMLMQQKPHSLEGYTYVVLVHVSRRRAVAVHADVSTCMQRMCSCALLQPHPDSRGIVVLFSQDLYVLRGT